MNDADKPAPEKPADVPPEPQPPAPPAPEPAARPRPPRERPRPGGQGPVPSLEHEQTYGFGKKIDAFDAEMERELQEAMGGLSEKEMYGEPQRGRAQPGHGGPQKGKVFRVRGQDVF